MKKKIIMRSLLGMPISVSVSLLITIIISYSIGDSNFHAVAPQLMEYCGNEINAVFWQFIFLLVYGAVWGGISVIWEMENWSILRQTATHFVICSVTTLPIAYIMCWVEHNVISVLIYFAIFAFIYVVIWLSQYLSTKSKIKKFNSVIGENNL